MNAIVADGLVKRFGSFTAVEDASFTVKAGEIFGFLGPNGAGKTTTMRMLSTLLAPTAGHATINGFDIANQRQQVRQSIGMIFQDPSLDDRLTGMENLRFHAMIYDVPPADFEARATELLSLVDLDDKVNEFVKTYSGGMRRRLEIVRGLLHHPAVLFLDEPTIGLDPQTRRHIWSYLLKLRAQNGITMFMTTHYMDEAEHCDRIAIVDNGRIVALDTPAGLKSLVGGDLIDVDTSDNIRTSAALAGRAGTEVRQGPNGHVIVETAAGERFIPEMMTHLNTLEPKVDVQTISLSRPTLEDVFVKLTGHAIRAQEADALQGMRMGARLFMGRRQ